MGLGPPQQYLAKYNGYRLPGYVQTESMDSMLNVADHYAPYVDGSLSEDVGLSNKGLALTLLVWEKDYLTCKEQIQQAATILRSNRGGWAPLYVQFPDKYYNAMVKSVKMDKAVPSSVRILTYSIEFECQPWLFGSELHTLSGTGAILVSRGIDNGSWTPTVVTLTGSNPSVHSVSDFGDGGLISVSGDVSGIVIDTDAFTATLSGENRNDLLNTDYRLQIGPGDNTITVNGDCTITYYDRWLL